MDTVIRNYWREIPIDLPHLWFSIEARKRTRSRNPLFIGAGDRFRSKILLYVEASERILIPFTLYA